MKKMIVLLKQNNNKKYYTVLRKKLLLPDNASSQFIEYVYKRTVIDEAYYEKLNFVHTSYMVVI